MPKKTRRWRRSWRTLLPAIAAVSVLAVGLAMRTYSAALREGVVEIQVDRIEQVEQPILWVDVRNQWEHDRDRIGNSHLVPVRELSSEAGIAQIQALIDEALRETGQEPLVLLYCERGIRSAVAHNRLAEAGIESVSLAGGIRAWRQQYPSVSTLGVDN